MPTPAAQAIALNAYGLSEKLWGMQPHGVDAETFMREIAENVEEAIKTEREACAKIADAREREAVAMYDSPAAGCARGIAAAIRARA